MFYEYFPRYVYDIHYFLMPVVYLLISAYTTAIGIMLLLALLSLQGHIFVVMRKNAQALSSVFRHASYIVVPTPPSSPQLGVCTIHETDFSQTTNHMIKPPFPISSLGGDKKLISTTCGTTTSTMIHTAATSTMAHVIDTSNAAAITLPVYVPINDITTEQFSMDIETYYEHTIYPSCNEE